MTWCTSHIIIWNMATFMSAQYSLMEVLKNLIGKHIIIWKFSDLLINIAYFLVNWQKECQSDQLNICISWIFSIWWRHIKAWISYHFRNSQYQLTLQSSTLVVLTFPQYQLAHLISLGRHVRKSSAQESGCGNLTNYLPQVCNITFPQIT
jgi:hypothetical protein